MLTRKDNSYIESIRILLNSDIDPNLSDQEGKTALLHAIEFGSLESIPLLIQSGASINSGNNQEESYLIYLRDLQLIDNDRYLKITKALARANLL
jgi:ankyrin repeat protein